MYSYRRVCTSIIAFEITVEDETETCVDKIADAMAEYAMRLKEGKWAASSLDKMSVDAVMSNGVKARAITANNIESYVTVPLKNLKFKELAS